MNNYNFKSIFKHELENFINFKKGIGYIYSDKVIANFKLLDNFFIEINLNEKRIDDEIIDKWLSKSTNLSNKTRYNYYSVISMFTKYLVIFDYKNIVIPEYNSFKYKNNFVPYIYTKDEMKNIFDFILSRRDKYDRYYKLYMCINLLYCCGLRIGELLNLTLHDIDFKKKTLIIKNGKNNVDRIIPLTDNLYCLLIEYIQHENINDDKIYIFYSNIGRISAANNIRRNFRVVLKNVGIEKRYNNQYPRIHDLRHTFAVNALEQMKRKGFDTYVSLPILSCYLGHKSIVETEYYLRLVPENFNRITDANKHLSDLYRKDQYYEE